MVYFDNAATTRVRQEVTEAMMPFFSEEYGNPSGVYTLARTAKKALERAREDTACVINAEKNEIYFTSGGTEANNTAIFSVARAYAEKGRHIITTAIEHHAVLHPCRELEKRGYEVTYLPVDENGFVGIEAFEKAVRSDTILASVMFANNEIGTIQPIKEIGRIAAEKGVVFHTDAVQAAGHIPIDVKDMNISLLSMSGHKIYGPKGVGALYCKNGVKMPPVVHGGGQERNRRAGTENVAGIVGFARALTLMNEEMNENAAHDSRLRDMLTDGILSVVPNARLNGGRDNRLPGNCNISFSFIEGESLLLHLDLKGIAASSGSACTTGSLDPSHVLTAIGLDHALSHGSLRLTVGRYNTDEDVKAVLAELPLIVQKLREMSPLYNREL